VLIYTYLAPEKPEKYLYTPVKYGNLGPNRSKAKTCSSREGLE